MKSPEGAAPTLSAQKTALIRVAVGVPMLFLSLFALLLAYRVSGRPLGDRVFWLALVAVCGGFALYFAKPLWSLLRRK